MMKRVTPVILALAFFGFTFTAFAQAAAKVDVSSEETRAIRTI
jgi:multidrug transporter EmrE-like cation transporter